MSRKERRNARYLRSHRCGHGYELVMVLGDIIVTDVIGPGHPHRSSDRSSHRGLLPVLAVYTRQLCTIIVSDTRHGTALHNTTWLVTARRRQSEYCSVLLLFMLIDRNVGIRLKVSASYWRPAVCGTGDVVKTVLPFCLASFSEKSETDRHILHNSIIIVKHFHQTAQLRPLRNAVRVHS
ncbi:hypothetical protein J6590_017536 [Homalodisca vitripennis]|nr:hypothetical protein J6590_017536 [Homalodisca vitripennis]